MNSFDGCDENFEYCRKASPKIKLEIMVLVVLEIEKIGLYYSEVLCMFSNAFYISCSYILR